MTDTLPSCDETRLIIWRAAEIPFAFGGDIEVARAICAQTDGDIPVRCPHTTCTVQDFGVARDLAPWDIPGTAELAITATWYAINTNLLHGRFRPRLEQAGGRVVAIFLDGH